MENQEIFKQLSRLDPKLVKILTKEYTRNGQKKQFSVKYITARTVMNMLDTIVGPANWRAEYQPLTSTVMSCTLYLRIDGEWIGKMDVGTPSDIEPEKGAVSDALKRAAVQWGIGRELYNEGTATFEDDEPVSQVIHENAEESRPKATKNGQKTDTMPEPPATDALEEVFWTRDTERVKEMIRVAGEYWKLAAGPNLYNRILKALELPERNVGKRDDLVAYIQEAYTRTADNARAAIKAYESEPAPVQ
jgi:hypothetical protein